MVVTGFFAQWFLMVTSEHICSWQAFNAHMGAEVTLEMWFQKQVLVKFSEFDVGEKWVAGNNQT